MAEFRFKCVIKSETSDIHQRITFVENFQALL